MIQAFREYLRQSKVIVVTKQRSQRHPGSQPSKGPSTLIGEVSYDEKQFTTTQVRKRPTEQTNSNRDQSQILKIGSTRTNLNKWKNYRDSVETLKFQTMDCAGLSMSMINGRKRNHPLKDSINMKGNPVFFRLPLVLSTTPTALKGSESTAVKIKTIVKMIFTVLLKWRNPNRRNHWRLGIVDRLYLIGL
ncbi:hypothetical protein MJO28_001442 [Puccinia striiformis f. sp. tritici]|uniref:Uncharacterized protein n=1 Tax=Puccinia striiformis f. sp. tritici TaxID=168172 RepID=A0ACC0EX12_9BASI|nr:hypothetical protein MJO28_001442 [Puccinia striiformis f. sp. tritici]